MAKRRSTSKPRARRKRAAPRTRARVGIKAAAVARDEPASGSTPDSPSLPEDLEEAIEDERSRLMRAHSILGCITLALEGDDGVGPNRPYYPDLIELARDLVNESINGLDSNKLRRFIDCLQPR